MRSKMGMLLTAAVLLAPVAGQAQVRGPESPSNAPLFRPGAPGVVIGPDGVGGPRTPGSPNAPFDPMQGQPPRGWEAPPVPPRFDYTPPVLPKFDYTPPHYTPPDFKAYVPSYDTATGCVFIVGFILSALFGAGRATRSTPPGPPSDNRK